MPEVALRVGAAEWREWLWCVADTRSLRALELPGDVIAGEAAALLPLLTHLRLGLAHVADAVPAALGRYASEAGLADDPARLQALLGGLRARLQGGVRWTSVDVGLDRLATEGYAAGLQRRLHFLRLLIHGLEPLGVRVAVRVRWPRPFADSHEWEWAANLLHDLADERCRLALDVVLSDLPDDVRPEALLRDCSAHLAVLRLHVPWGAGEGLPESSWAAWAAAWRRLPGPLTVVFCPPPLAAAQAPRLLAAVEAWAGLSPSGSTAVDPA
ncbi:MAG: hypothetical protein GX595_03950 [Lentisphaerae bacterium]|nr:hypothetical protein [Lentisphaerota bacterium]